MTREEIFKIADECGLVHFPELQLFALQLLKAEKNRIADQIAQLPFGDTAASFSVYVREM